MRLISILILIFFVLFTRYKDSVLFEPRTNNNYFFPKNTCIIIILVFLQALD